MTALLAISLSSHAQTAAPDPALAEALGLTAAGAGWRYREPEKEPRMLGQPHDEGAFYTIGLSGSF